MGWWGWITLSAGWHCHICSRWVELEAVQVDGRLDDAIVQATLVGNVL